MKHLGIAENLSLPLEVVTEKLAMLGRTGSGKSYTGMKLAELMLEHGAQVGVIDPVGVWPSLRVPAQSGGSSFDIVIFGGLYGDLPIQPSERAGELIADVICDRGISFILDVSQFMPTEQQRFVRGFADRFFHRKKASPSAVHLFMEECQEYIPENPSGGEEQKTLGVMQRMWKLGRNFGIGGTLISQRPQEVAKKALNMSGTMFAFQMTGPQERAAVRKWVADKGVAIDIESILQKLKVGEPHIESPTFLGISKTVHIAKRITADLSSTPKVGAATATKRALTPIDIEKLKAQLSETIEKAKAEDPKELKRRIQELERDIRQMKTQGVNHAELDEIKSKWRQDEKDWVAERDALQSELVQYQKAVKSMRDVCDGLLSRPKLETGPGRALQIVLPRDNPATLRPAPPAKKPDHRPTDSSLPGAERKILTVLAQHPEGKDTTALAHLSGYTVNGHFNNMLGSLRSKGFAHRGNPVVITTAGLDALGDYDPLPTGRQLQEYWLAKLPGAERRILKPLLDIYPGGCSAADLASAAGYTVNGHFNNMLGHLRTIELVQRGSPIRASDTLFE